MNYALVALGGLAGGLLRYGIGYTLPPQALAAEILMVNLFGSFALGLLYGFGQSTPLARWIRFGFGSGVLSSFTSFSTFCWYSDKLVTQNIVLGGAYAAATMIGGPLLALCGNQLAKWLAQRSTPDAKEDAVA